MDHYEKYTEAKTVIRHRLIKTTCDRCNNEIPSESSYDFREFDLSFAEGTSYPEGSGDKKGWEVEDLCNLCIDFLHGLLIESGFKVTEIEMDW